MNKGPWACVFNLQIYRRVEISRQGDPSVKNIIMHSVHRKNYKTTLPNSIYVLYIFLSTVLVNALVLMEHRYNLSNMKKNNFGKKWLQNKAERQPFKAAARVYIWVGKL
jgi:hypothetical protein